MTIDHILPNPFDSGTTESYLGILEDGRRVIWKPHEWKWAYEIAAYEISEVFGFGLVPRTERTEFQGRVGSAQIFVEGIPKDVICIRDRRTGLRKYVCRNAIQARLELQELFDFVIYNSDRSPNHNWILTSDGDVVSIDHDGAFYGYKERRCRLCNSQIHENPLTLGTIICPKCLTHNSFYPIPETFPSLEMLRERANRYVADHPNSLLLISLLDKSLQSHLETKLKNLISDFHLLKVFERIDFLKRRE